IRGVELNRDFLFTVIRFLFVILVAILCVFLLIYLSKLTAPFIIGALLALIINPLVDFLQIITKMSHGLSVISSLVIILCVISTMFILLFNEDILIFIYLYNIVLEKFNKFILSAHCLI